MNTSQLITHLRSQKAVINILHGKLKIRVSEKVMTPEIITDIRSHKSEIIQFLQVANEETPKRYAYRFVLENNHGGGTWITDSPPDEARKVLQDFYENKKISEFGLIN